jgi:hypothetical protein
MSSTLQAVVLEPSLTGLGFFPYLTPAHHAELLTGMSAGIGGLAFLLPVMLGNLMKPVSGSVDVIAMCYTSWCVIEHG